MGIELDVAKQKNSREEANKTPGDTPNDVKSNVLEKPHFSGLVLICDDTVMSQQVICTLLARVGLRTVVAENGKAGLEMVRERIQKDEKPFDLIFMDILMPVMDGTEAASKITELGAGIPIVAMTSNITEGELEKYRTFGMPDCLCKPFSTQDLWRVLLKYLTPVSSSVVNQHEERQEKNELQKKLRTNFVKSNQTKYNEITEAIAANDIQLARRLAHTLKGNAGMIRKTGLQSAAAEIEALLKDGKIPIPEDKMNRLQTELMLVLEELRPLLDTISAREVEPLNAEQIRSLFEKLEPMLENINPECVNMLDDINAVPGAEELARQIADYDFESAALTLDELKKKWV